MKTIIFLAVLLAKWLWQYILTRPEFDFYRNEYVHFATIFHNLNGLYSLFVGVMPSLLP